MPVPRVAGSTPRPAGLLGAALILLALWVQLLAPAGALRMVLGETAGLPGAILCGHGPDSAGEDLPAGRPAQACALCQLCCAGLAPPPAPMAPARTRSLRWSVVAWPIRPPARSSAVSHLAAQPRAPPVAA